MTDSSTSVVSRFSLMKAACAIAVATSVVLPTAASAAAAPPGEAHYFFGTPNGSSILPPSLPEVAAATSYTSIDGFATATFTLAPEASIQLDLRGPTYIGAAFEYFYTLTGPGFMNPGDTVAGTLTTSMSATGTGSMVAAAALVGDGLTLGHSTGVCFSTIGICPSEYGSSLSNESIPVLFESSGVLEIATAARVFSGTASAFIDPVITLPAGYTIQLSAGVVNGAPPVTSVPEPSTFASLAAGLGLLGAFMRRRARRDENAGGRA